MTSLRIKHDTLQSVIDVSDLLSRDYQSGLRTIPELSALLGISDHEATKRMNEGEVSREDYLHARIAAQLTRIAEELEAQAPKTEAPATDAERLKLAADKFAGQITKRLENLLADSNND